MRRSKTYTRNGFSLLEVLAVVALLIIVGVLIIPSLSSFTADTNVKGAADLCVARLADARGFAISEGRAYRFSVSSDGKQILVGPDDVDGSGQSLETQDPDNPIHHADATLPPTVVLTPTSASADTDGWNVIVVYLPDGTCRDANSQFTLKEVGVVDYIVKIRGLTGAVSYYPAGSAKDQ